MGSNLISLRRRENMLALVFLSILINIIYLIKTPRDNSVRLRETALDWSLLTLTGTLVV